MPAVSKEALGKMSDEVRRWRLHRRPNFTFAELAKEINPIVAGWMNYYGRFYRSQLYPLLQRINTYLMRWAGKKYRRTKDCGDRFICQEEEGSVPLDREPGLRITGTCPRDVPGTASPICANSTLSPSFGLGGPAARHAACVP
jgi:hypothetical protein